VKSPELRKLLCKNQRRTPRALSGSNYEAATSRRAPKTMQMSPRRFQLIQNTQSDVKHYDSNEQTAGPRHSSVVVFIPSWQDAVPSHTFTGNIVASATVPVRSVIPLYPAYMLHSEPPRILDNITADSNTTPTHLLYPPPFFFFFPHTHAIPPTCLYLPQPPLLRHNLLFPSSRHPIIHHKSTKKLHTIRPHRNRHLEAYHIQLTLTMLQSHPQGIENNVEKNVQLAPCNAVTFPFRQLSYYV
jgi:hypothetical protein